MHALRRCRSQTQKLSAVQQSVIVGVVFLLVLWLFSLVMCDSILTVRPAMIELSNDLGGTENRPKGPNVPRYPPGYDTEFIRRFKDSGFLAWHPKLSTYHRYCIELASRMRVSEDCRFMTGVRDTDLVDPEHLQSHYSRSNSLDKSLSDEEIRMKTRPKDLPPYSAGGIISPDYPILYKWYTNFTMHTRKSRTFDSSTKRKYMTTDDLLYNSRASRNHRLNHTYKSISLVTQLPMRGLPVLCSGLCRSWKGPISLAVLVRLKKGQLTRESNPGYHFEEELTASLRCCQQWLESVSVLFAAEFDKYPINHLRNLALQQTHADYVFLCDPDFAPSNSMYRRLMSPFYQSYLNEEMLHSNPPLNSIIYHDQWESVAAQSHLTLDVVSRVRQWNRYIHVPKSVKQTKNMPFGPTAFVIPALETPSKQLAKFLRSRGDVINKYRTTIQRQWREHVSGEADLNGRKEMIVGPAAEYPYSDQLYSLTNYEQWLRGFREEDSQIIRPSPMVRYFTEDDEEDDEEDDDEVHGSIQKLINETTSVQSGKEEDTSSAKTESEGRSHLKAKNKKREKLYQELFHQKMAESRVFYNNHVCFLPDQPKSLPLSDLFDPFIIVKRKNLHRYDDRFVGLSKKRSRHNMLPFLSRCLNYNFRVMYNLFVVRYRREASVFNYSATLVKPKSKSWRTSLERCVDYSGFVY